MEGMPFISEVALIIGMISFFVGIGFIIYSSIKNKELLDVIEKMKEVEKAYSHLVRELLNTEKKHIKQLEDADRINKELFSMIKKMEENEKDYVSQLEDADMKIDELEHDLKDAEECCAITEEEFSRS